MNNSVGAEHFSQARRLYSQNISAGVVAERLAQQAEAVAAFLLPNGRRINNKWCCGSIHGEEGESLKVVLSGEKAGRWKDFADGGQHGDLLDLWAATRGISPSQAFKEALDYLGMSRVSKPANAQQKSALKLIHTWHYRDADGNAVGRTVRYEDSNGKKLVIPHFNQGGKKGMPKDFTPPLYGKPDPRYVFIVEGEKCVDPLLQMGLPAITSQGGCQAARKADWSALDGVETVYFLPDNDQAGSKYVSDVAACLEAKKLGRKMLLVELNGLPESGDIVDWIQARIPDWDGYAEDDRIAGLKGKLRERVKDAKPVELDKTEDAPIHDCILINLDSVKMEPLEWLWPGRFPLAKLCLLGGKPGVGKTQIALSIAAIVTVGGRWFDSSTRATPAHVLFLTSEDDLADTVKPRLVAAGADTSKVTVLKSVATKYEDRVVDRLFSLGRDIQQLHGVLSTDPKFRLVIFDPLQAYLGVKDSHRNADVREVLGPLSDLAIKHRVTVLGIEHLGKSAGRVDPMAAFLGSTGIIASARSAYLVCKDKNDDQGDRLFLPVKQNLSPEDSGLTYRLIGKNLDNGIQTSTIEWTGRTDTTARDALDESGHRHDAPAMEDATYFLEQLLADGPVKAKKVEEEIKAAGHAPRTVQRAKAELGIKSKNRGRFHGNEWWWMTPEQLAKDESKNDDSGGDCQHMHAGELPQNTPEFETEERRKTNDGKGLRDQEGVCQPPEPEKPLGQLPKTHISGPKNGPKNAEEEFV